MLPGPYEVHVWVCRIPTESPELARKLRSLLPARETDAAQRFVHTGDRWRFRVTRGMVRLVLSEYADVPAGQWVFSSNEYGRPEVDTRSGLLPSIAFNISHAGDFVVLAVAADRTIGVDVEAISAHDSAGIAQGYFTREEADALRALSRECQETRFIELWTLKESYLKARGLGLSLPLDTVRFDFPPGTRLAVDFMHSHDPFDFALWSLQPGYRLALCVPVSGHEEVRLSLRQFTSFGPGLDPWPQLLRSTENLRTSDSMQNDAAAAQ